MTNQNFLNEIKKRRTFAIISHPDAGKTTVTEKILLLGNMIKTSGTIKGRGSNQFAKSDWMEIEKKRGISITTSVMQFPYGQYLINLLDTPGHEDFSEDTYRTLTAVDSCLMVIDATKGVEDRTLKLMAVTRLRNTPILTFINKLDCESRCPVEIIDELEKELKIPCAPITWPIGCGKLFKGVYHIYNNTTYLYHKYKDYLTKEVCILKALNNPDLDLFIGEDLAKQLREEIKMVQGASHIFDYNSFLSGNLMPVFFGTALGNFGVDHMLDGLTAWAPAPLSRQTNLRKVNSEEEKFSGFIFKIQANMDKKHRDRIAYMRIVSGCYEKGMKLYQVRTKKEVIIPDALRFIAEDRIKIGKAFAGDIIGLHNHGTIQIGDTFTQGEVFQFTGIPYFAPEIFRRVRLRDPLKQKQLLKGLLQLAEEGAIQIFRPIVNNDLIVGAIGNLQFDVVAFRLKNEYYVEAVYESVNVTAARWIECKDIKKLEEFKFKNELNLAEDSGKNLSYIAPTIVNLNLIQERYPSVLFHKTREH